MNQTRVSGVFLGCWLLFAGGCATAPKMKDRPALIGDGRVATAWFEQNVSGLREQIDDSAGYIVFPSITQWGLGYSGGKWGRGLVNDSDDSQIGWAAISTPSLGLQAGVQGFKMLVVMEDAGTLESFKKGRLSGSASGVAVVGEAGRSAKVPFENGVAVYQGANTGLMAGVNVGLDLLRYEAIED
ncbi:MAG: hypothetical protein JSU86_18030 [Phycisphaerales bacterium]|nr:MAG: hypothetical protein JSU86_18030 [Phycisphaerales bacterium]